MFKKPPRRELTGVQEHFNDVVSRVRVLVENAIGILKAKFQSLKGLRTVVCSEKDMKFIIDWITVCVILHNRTIDDTWANDLMEEEEENEDELQDNATNSVAQERGERRQRIADQLYYA